jgi:hypothetical protein
MLASTLRPSAFLHNTMLGIQNTFLSMPAALNPGLTFSNDVVAGGLYGIAGNGNEAVGLSSLNQGAPAAVMQDNVIDGNVQRTVPYPPGNYPLAAGVLAMRLDPQDRYLGTEKSTDGLALGADITGLLAHIPWLTIP